MVSQRSCGERGNCLVYDSSDFRTQFLLLGFVGKGMSFLCFYLSYRTREDTARSPRTVNPGPVRSVSPADHEPNAASVTVTEMVPVRIGGQQ